MHYVFDPPPQPSIPVAGSSRHFPVHRIYCVGRNYAAHVREMGGNPDRELPFFFLKPASALVAPGCAAAYPPGTTNLHHEVELVVAIGRPAAAISTAQALEVVWGYAVGNDLTRRDLQLAARDKGRPMGFWQILRRIGANLRAASEQLDRASLERRDLAQGQRHERQRSDLEQMIWTVPEIISELSKFYHLVPGDLIFTGTPEGVGPLQVEDRIEAGIERLDTLSHGIRQPT